MWQDQTEVTLPCPGIGKLWVILKVEIMSTDNNKNVS